MAASKPHLPFPFTLASFPYFPFPPLSLSIVKLSSGWLKSRHVTVIVEELKHLYVCFPNAD